MLANLRRMSSKVIGKMYRTMEKRVCRVSKVNGKMNRMMKIQSRCRTNIKAVAITTTNTNQKKYKNDLFVIKYFTCFLSNSCRVCSSIIRQVNNSTCKH